MRRPDTWKDTALGLVVWLAAVLFVLWTGGVFDGRAW